MKYSNGTIEHTPGPWIARGEARTEKYNGWTNYATWRVNLGAEAE